MTLNMANCFTEDVCQQTIDIRCFALFATNIMKIMRREICHLQISTEFSHGWYTITNIIILNLFWTNGSSDISHWTSVK